MLAIFDAPVPTYGLSDNEKTLTLDHIARIAVRHPTMVEVGRHYGLTLASCVPADPQSKGGSEATVRISAADLVPCDANLLGAYESFAALETACDAFCAHVNSRVHATTHRVPAEMLVEERLRLHPTGQADYRQIAVTTGVFHRAPRPT